MKSEEFAIMVNKELIEYVKGELAKGSNRSTVRKQLMWSGGWAGSDIDEVFQIIEGRETVWHSGTSASVGHIRTLSILLVILIVGAVSYFQWGLPYVPDTTKWGALSYFADYTADQTDYLAAYLVMARDQTDQVFSMGNGGWLSGLNKIGNMAGLTIGASPASKPAFVIKDCGSRASNDTGTASDGAAGSECFVAEFSACRPATISSVSTHSGKILSYQIIGETKGQCRVLEEATVSTSSIPISRMSCLFDNSKELAIALQDRSKCSAQ